MTDIRGLLTDEQMSQFLSRGYLILQNDAPAELHQAILHKVDAAIQGEGNPGNNLLARVPEIQVLFNRPIVKGALASILGDDYIMHPHRHCHFNRPGSDPQKWHKDGYWSAMRHHRPWWAMIFYYLHDVTDDMGPSAVMPGTQAYARRPPEDAALDQHVLGKAGTFALIHFDVWHRASANQSQIKRYMMKFQFVRMRPPTQASWNHQRPFSRPADAPPFYMHEGLWKENWRWLGGRVSDEAAGTADLGTWVDALRDADPRRRAAAADALGRMGRAGADAAPALSAALGDAVEPVAINAAYALAAMGDAGVVQLLDVLQAGGDEAAPTAAYGLAAAGRPAREGLLASVDLADEVRRGYVAFALGELDDATAIPSLIDRARNDRSEWVRRNAIEALGLMSETNPIAIETLTDTIAAPPAEPGQDPSGQPWIKEKLRYAAALSLTRLGPAAADAVPVLAKALHDDEDRYVRAYSADALFRIATPAAMNALVEHLLTARWCPTTTPASTF